MLVALLVPVAANAETKDEWITLGARIPGAFGPFIPVGIRIGLDARDKLKADPRGLTVTYYNGSKPPKILGWIKSDPSARYDAAMNPDGLFQDEPIK